jgi:Rieske Fe-S protein
MTLYSVLQSTPMQIAYDFPDRAGEYLTPQIGRAPGELVICRLRFDRRCPPGAVEVAPEECVVAFSRKCSHMGCYLVPDAPTVPRPLPGEKGLLRCPCHSSCFDLHARGLVVGGPATDWLAQLELRPVLDPQTSKVIKVEEGEWIRQGSAGYGVPFGGTAANPDGHRTS